MSIANLAKRLKDLKGVSIDAGFFKEHKYPDGTSVSYVATIQEYGYRANGINIPPRPFMRPAKAANSKKWGKIVAKQAAQYLVNEDLTIDQAFDPAGQMMQQDIEDKIINGDHAPLSRITLLLRKWKREGRIVNKSVVEEARRYLEMFPNAQVSGNTTPLNDTGLLLASISYRVNQ